MHGRNAKNLPGLYLSSYNPIFYETIQTAS